MCPYKQNLELTKYTLSVFLYGFTRREIVGDYVVGHFSSQNQLKSSHRIVS
jgi:hypothetical protein